MINNKNNIITIIIGIIISSAIFLITLKSEIDKNKIYFVSNANNSFSRIESTFLSFNRINHELSSRFYLSEEMNDNEFSFYAKSIIKQHNYIDEIIFAENIPVYEKARYEKNFQTKGYSGFKITPFNKNSYQAPVTKKYVFPVKFIEPYTVKNSLWFGKNLLTFSIQGNIVTKKHDDMIRYTTNNNGKKFIYAIQTLYKGHKYEQHNISLENIYGLLVYKINPDKLVTAKNLEAITISLNGIKVFEKNKSADNGLFDITTFVSKSMNLNNTQLTFNYIYSENIFAMNIVFPAILFVFGLMLTWFIWYVIHSHIQINNILREQNKVIEKEVKTKTKELIIRADELEAFSYSVSHDLRTPLNAIDGFSQILLDSQKSSADKETLNYIQHICTASLKMGHIIDDLLKFAHVSRSNFEKKKVNISKVIEYSIHTMREYEPDREIELVIQKDVYALADESFLQICFDNLISNAWKFTKNNDHPRIEFGTLYKDEILIYFICDNGAGFDMSEANKLFTAFQRLHQKSEFEGVGVGLSTVQRIIQKHDGDIWAESEIGKGATFYFTLGTD
ncbi:MAG TPA: GHKL domain-containing protein [Gammaproteobacteria bacterium]|nr:GHKL domain-containing protein [Gammaproteobacteria bacterium]